MHEAPAWTAILPGVTLVLGAVVAGARWISKMNRLAQDYAEHVAAEKLRIAETKATEALVAANAEHIAELTRNVDRVIRAWDEFLTRKGAR